MKQNKTMITAEKILSKHGIVVNKTNTSSYTTKSNCKSAMIEFAKIHVKEALKEALDSIPCLGSSSDIASYEEVEDAVLNAYPSELIK